MMVVSVSNSVLKSEKFVFKNSSFTHMKNDQPRRKKSLGQHFLRRESVVRLMIEKVKDSCNDAVILEIGCGDGFLTRNILEQTNCARLVCLEIDLQWVEFVKRRIKDPRLEILNANALDVDWSKFSDNGSKSMVMLANLPYNVTFPIIKKLRENATLFTEGVIMVQDEVAQKFVAKSGRNFGFVSLLLQHTFDMSLMAKVGPESFCPPPKVSSRLVHFKPKAKTINIEREENFWRFIRVCFSAPRKMLKNNLRCYNVNPEIIERKVGGLRAQQMNFNQLLELWEYVRSSEVLKLRKEGGPQP